MNNKVSIIIPNFNRAHLISDTLESIVAQDYKNWECIIIDDHSTDKSIQVIKDFIGRDIRFKVVKRPEHKPKGANSCRNYGFELSNGELIQWFDSDDIMTPDQLQILVDAISENEVDFAVGESMNFKEGKGFIGKPYDFEKIDSDINAFNFGKQKIGWITDDFLGKKEIFQGLSFNEKYKTDGDEYNFFTRLLHLNNNGKFINKIITHRRIHSGTLSDIDNMSTLEYNQKIATIKYLTLEDILIYKNERLIKWFLSGYMQYAFEIAVEKKTPPFLLHSIPKIFKNCGFKNGLYFILSIISGTTVGKGYYFLRRALKFQ